MAKQVSNVFIRLGIENFEGIEKLKSAFRELDKSIGPTSRSIDAAIAAVKSYANESTRSEQLIRGQIEAFKGLRSQVDVSGSSYVELTAEISQLQAELRGSTDAVERQRQALLSNFNQNERNVRTIHEHVRALAQLQSQTRANSSAFIALGADVEAAALRLADAQKAISTLRTALTRGLPATGAGAQNRMTELDEGIRAQRAIIDEIDLRTSAERKLASVIRERADAEEILNRSLVDRRQLAFQESARAGREDARIAAAAFSNAPVGGTGFLSIENIGRRIGDVPNTIAGINQELGEMRERLSNAALEGRDFIAVLDYIDDLNRRLRLATTEFQTPRQQARAAVQARLDAQREQLSQGGFGAFSADINRRDLRRSANDVQEAFTAIAAARETMESAVQNATARTLQQELNAAQLIEEGDQRAHTAYMQRKQQEADAGERWFKEELARLDILSQQRKAAASAMNLGGRELSPLYQRITGLATTGVAQQQQFMGRSATAVYTDVVNAFNAGGRPVDLKNKSTYIGESIAEGVSEGAKNSPAILSGARYFAHKVLVTYRREIASELSRYGDILFGGPGAVFGLGRADVAVGRQRTAIADTAAGLRSSGAFPIEGMMGPSSPLEGGLPPSTPRGNDRAFDKINADIARFGDLNRRSIADLQNLKATLGQVHSELSPLDADYRKINRAIEQQNTLIDKQLVRRQQGGGRSLGGRQLAQISGAAISGGIFGGVEGFLGGVAGGIFGGVGGSFAGAAAGAQVGMLRQQLAGTADYAAQIGKLQIALRGVSGSQANYNQAISAAASATRDLNIPQQEATAGITRLSAAVLGAGGQMSDAAFAFRAISESIKATGGNAEQVDGALLALTQVFSKGKVSAEELNQIAERLPGTFTLFAKATGKTGPELQKALQDGTVGLNDLMKFLELASTKHGQTALKIAASNEEAGTRMSNAFKVMSLEVGKALLPIGAEIQTSFAKFATDMIPTLTATAKGIAALLKTIIDNGEAVIALTKLALVFAGTNIAIKNFVSLRAALSITFLAIKSFFGNVSAQALLARQQIQRFAASITAPLVISLAIVGVEGVLSSLQRVEEVRKRAESSGKNLQGDAYIKQIGGSALTTRDIDKALRENDQRFNVLLPYVRIARQEAAARNFSLKDARDIVRDPKFYTPKSVEIASQLVEAENQLLTLQSRRAALLRQRQIAKPPVPLPDAISNKSDADAKAKRDKTAADAQRTAETLAQQQIRLDDTVFAHRQDLARQEYELRKELLDLETKNRLDQMGSVEREAAQALEQRNQRETQYRERLMQAEADVAKAQQDLLSARRMAAATGGGTAGRAGLPAGMSGYISGDPRSPYYQADHGGTNYHEHLSFVSRKAAEAAYALLVKAGLKVTEFRGYSPVGRHTPDSAHYSGLAMDVPASQVPVGAERSLTARVVAALGIGTTAASAQQRRNIVDTGDAGVAAANLAQAKARLARVREYEARYTAATEVEYTNTLTKAFRDQNEELQRTIANETLRANLQSKGYTESYIDLQLKLSDALDRRDKQISTLSFVEAETPNRIDAINSSYKQLTESLQQLYLVQESLANAPGFREGAKRYVESLGTMREATANLTQQGFKGLEDTLVSLSTTGTANFQAFAASILEQTARMIIQQLVLKTIMQALGAIGGGPDRSFATLMAGVNKYSANANGNVFAANGIVPYAMGGIVTRPTLFPFAKGGAIGTGLMGEAGPEAIIPLSRGANGKLGIAGGGGTTNVVVNVDASGNAQVQGREDTATQLGRVVSQAVQAELVKQKRPGGLLA